MQCCNKSNISIKGSAILAIFVLLFSLPAIAEEKLFNVDPGVYRSAFYGHLLNGRVVVEGVPLGIDESVVRSISYVHGLKNNKWFRVAKITSDVLCIIKSTENPGYYIAGIDTHLSVDGKKVLKVHATHTTESDPKFPKRECVEVNNK